MDRTGRFKQIGKFSIYRLWILQIFPRTGKSDGVDLARMTMTLNSDTRLKFCADSPKAKFHVDLSQLEHDAFGKRDEREFSFASMQCLWNSFDGNGYRSHNCLLSQMELVLKGFLTTGPRIERFYMRGDTVKPDVPAYKLPPLDAFVTYSGHNITLHQRTSVNVSGILASKL